MGDNTEDMDIEIEQTDKKTDLLENTLGFPDSEVIEKMNRMGLNNLSSKQKDDMNKNRLNISLNNHKNIKNKEQ